MNIRHFLMTFIALMLCGNLMAQTTIRHEVKAGETLYSISNRYGVTISDIQAANPDLGEVLLAGKVIIIPAKKSAEPITVLPVSKEGANPVKESISTALPLKEVPMTTIMARPTATAQATGKEEAKVTEVADDEPKVKQTYEVRKKETMFSIAKDFGVTVDELRAVNPSVRKDNIKKGMTLNIPYTQAELEAMKPVEEEEEIIVKEPVPVNMAVIMPFGLRQEKKSREAITMIDFYEGIMLAVSELKQQGVSGKVVAYDEEQIDSVLRLPQMKEMNLIIGAKEASNINKLVTFAEKNNIRLVVPLSSSPTLVNNTRHVFQVNQKMDNDAYSKSFEAVANMYPDANFVFVRIEDQTDKMDNVTRMKTYFNKEKIKYVSTELQELDSIAKLLSADRQNILIPSSSNKTAFDRIVKKLSAADLSRFDIDFLGYADWQAFAEKETEAFRKYNCSFFTSFYNDASAVESFAFNKKFRNTFGRDQFNTYPHYGMLGYDIANFFVMNMYVEGEDFEANIENLESFSLQNPMHFSHKNTWSGFVNNALMYVRYNLDGTISVKQL